MRANRIILKSGRFCPSSDICHEVGTVLKAWPLAEVSTVSNYELRGTARLLKIEPEGNLCAVGCGLINEAGGVVIHIENPIANFRKDGASDLAPDCGISLTANLRSDSKPNHIAFRGQIEWPTKIVSPAYADKRIEPVLVKRKTLAQPAS